MNRPPMNRPPKLRAFELANRLAVLVYERTRDFPTDERFGLTSQMRRDAVSVASNIVEGCARESFAGTVERLYPGRAGD